MGNTEVTLRQHLDRLQPTKNSSEEVLRGTLFRDHVIRGIKAPARTTFFLGTNAPLILNSSSAVSIEVRRPHTRTLRAQHVAFASDGTLVAATLEENYLFNGLECIPTRRRGMTHAIAVLSFFPDGGVRSCEGEIVVQTLRCEHAIFRPDHTPDLCAFSQPQRFSQRLARGTRQLWLVDRVVFWPSGNIHRGTLACPAKFGQRHLKPGTEFEFDDQGRLRRWKPAATSWDVADSRRPNCSGGAAKTSDRTK